MHHTYTDSQPRLGLGYTLFYIYSIVLVYRDILYLLDEYY